MGLKIIMMIIMIIIKIIIIIIPCLDGVEEPHGVEETHSSASPLRLLPLHLQQSGERYINTKDIGNC